MLFRANKRGKTTKKELIFLGFTYKEQYAVVVICKDENEQKEIYNRLNDEGFTLKVVAV